jgi:hypothetical protein
MGLVITHYWVTHNSHGHCCPSRNSQGTHPSTTHPWDFKYFCLIFVFKKSHGRSNEVRVGFMAMDASWGVNSFYFIFNN